MDRLGFYHDQEDFEEVDILELEQRAIAQGQVTNEHQWKNANELAFYTFLKRDTDLTDNEIAGVMGYVDYVNPNYDTVLNDEHGGFFL